MRADARRNRERLLEAAVQTILEVGIEPPLDAIALRAGVGIGTLYRHFADRDVLMTAVAQHALDASIEAAEAASVEAADGCAALRRYMHAAVERGVGVLNLVYPLIIDPDGARRAHSVAVLGAILERGKREGGLRGDVEIPDIGFAVIRFSRPVAHGLPRGDEAAMAHRHLDVYLDGLETGAHTGLLPSSENLGWFASRTRP